MQIEVTHTQFIQMKAALENELKTVKEDKTALEVEIASLEPVIISFIVHIFSAIIDKIHYPFPKRQILDPSKVKEFADDNFRFVDNGRVLSKQVKNTVGKGEISRCEQFLLFLQCFQKTCSADT